jgi:PadR family transcriptional regulator PadR
MYLHIVNIKVSAYTFVMRRKPGALVPLESDICITAAELLKDGTPEFHGYELAKHLAAETSNRQSLVAYGTLYRALGRLVEMGMLTSHWEDPHIAAIESRPRRRFYSLTAAGRAASREAISSRPAAGNRLRKRWAPA